MKIVSIAGSFVALAVAALAASSALPSPTTPQKTVITSERFDMKTVGNETRSLFDGLPDKQVTLTGTNISITCDHLEVVVLSGGPTDAAIPNVEKFKYLLATGRVRIVQGDREATCGKAEVFPREDKIELTEKPVVLDRAIDFRGAGRKITMWRGDRHVVIDGSEFEGPEIKDLGFDKNQPAKAPTPAPSTPAAPTDASPAGISIPVLPPPQK